MQRYNNILNFLTRFFSFIRKLANLKKVFMNTIILKKSFIFFCLFFFRNTLVGQQEESYMSTLMCNHVSIDIMEVDTSVSFKGDLLILPGWNFERTRWCSESSLCKEAHRAGYRLIMPEMGKSIYATYYFPQTRKDWLRYPTLTWLLDTMIPFLQQQVGVFLTSDNFMIGLSTGARGVALIACRTNTFFKAAAALSGDYDQTLIPEDNLIKGVYGSFSLYSERWKTIDNPVAECAQIKIPIYIGHGKLDKVVPYTQSELLYKRLLSLKNGKKYILHTPEMGHDFLYWDSEVNPILDFFESIKE